MKTQMKFQKWLCLALLILGALSVVYSFAYCTGVLAGFGSTLESLGGYHANTSFKSGGNLFLEIQDFNNLLMYFGIILVLAAVVLYITATNKRRNYYISNYVASIAVALIFIVISIVAVAMNASWYSKTLEVLNDAEQMAAYKALSEDITSLGQITYSENTSMFIVGYVLYIINIVAAAALVLNLVWKIKLMKGEKALLQNGFAKEVA